MNASKRGDSPANFGSASKTAVVAWKLDDKRRSATLLDAGCRAPVSEIQLDTTAWVIACRRWIHPPVPLRSVVSESGSGATAGATAALAGSANPNHRGRAERANEWTDWCGLKITGELYKYRARWLRPMLTLDRPAIGSGEMPAEDCFLEQGKHTDEEIPRIRNRDSTAACDSGRCNLHMSCIDLRMSGEAHEMRSTAPACGSSFWVSDSYQLQAWGADYNRLHQQPVPCMHIKGATVGNPRSDPNVELSR